MGYLIALFTDVYAHTADVCRTIALLIGMDEATSWVTDVSAYCQNHNEAMSTPPLVSLTLCAIVLKTWSLDYHIVANHALHHYSRHGRHAEIPDPS